MSIQTDSSTTEGVSQRLERLKKKCEKTLEDVTFAKDVKKKIDRLMNQLPLSQQWEQKLHDRFSQLDRCSSFCSIRDKLDEINDQIRQLAAEANQDVAEENIIEKEDGVVERLQASYEFFHGQLNHDPRICLCLAIFPGKAVLRKRFLIYWWIGEGFIKDEEEGEQVFEDLLDLGLLIPYRTDKCPRVTKCQIFPWIRCMLISVAIKEKLLRLDSHSRPRFYPNVSRRICLTTDDEADLANAIGNERDDVLRLRTIFNVNKRDLVFVHQEFAKLNDLVVLQLGRWQVFPNHHIEVPSESFLRNLKTQKFLKYLSLRGISRITSLPNSIKELISLEILDLKACHNLETLPAAIASLTKLTHLDVSQCYLLESLPKGLDKLTSLQVLKGFIIGSSLKTPIRIKHLQKSLKSLKRLSIHIESEASIQKDEFDKLKDFKELKCLKISWGKVVKDKNVEEYSLSFPESLQKLDLVGIPQKTTESLQKQDLEGIPHMMKPEWLRPSKLGGLETLCIKGGKKTNLSDKGKKTNLSDKGEQWNLLDEGEQWNNVKYLVLKYTKMKQIKQETLKSVFPSLQYVKKVEWGENGVQHVQYEWNKDDIDV